MRPESDMALLQEYSRQGSEEAFRALVDRHINLVHAVAFRETGCQHLAEDVTQAVFIVLAEKASSIPSGTLLTGWLFRATRFAASNANRAEARRQHWEQKAAEMEPTLHSDPDEEAQIPPLLNEAIASLPERDRMAVLLRFFENKSHEEVARTLGGSEDAAKMRVSRALEKLRLIFRRRGVVVPMGAIIAALSAQGTHAAPTGLASTTASLAFLKQTTASTLPIVNQTLSLMAKTKLKSISIAVILLLLAGSAAVLVPILHAPRGPRGAAPAHTVSITNATATTLVFRDSPSWNRNPDFEDALASAATEFEVRPSGEMGTLDLNRYRVIILPGAQQGTEFYKRYAAQFSRFEQFVTQGGVLVLELNGAERAGIPLPLGVRMMSNGSKENAILLKDHPVMAPLQGRTIRANFASHGYLGKLPPEALVLVSESIEGVADLGRPTFAEYPVGKGRVLAACQCFHDRDGSGRGPLMDTVLDYAAERKWYAKAP